MMRFEKVTWMDPCPQREIAFANLESQQPGYAHQIHAQPLSFRTMADEKIYRASTTAPVNIAVIKCAQLDCNQFGTNDRI